MTKQQLQEFEATYLAAEDAADDATDCLRSAQITWARARFDDADYDDAYRALQSARDAASRAEQRAIDTYYRFMCAVDAAHAALASV